MCSPVLKLAQLALSDCTPTCPPAFVCVHIISEHKIRQQPCGLCIILLYILKYGPVNLPISDWHSSEATELPRGFLSWNTITVATHHLHSLETPPIIEPPPPHFFVFVLSDAANTPPQSMWRKIICSHDIIQLKQSLYISTDKGIVLDHW